MHVSRNYPIDDYFRHTLHNNTTKHEQIHCSIVCFGDCRTAKFFTDLSDLATKYKLNHPVQLNLSGEDSIKQIAPGDEFSYLLTTSGKCYSIGSGCAMGSRMLRSTTEPKLVHNVIDIVHVSHAYQRTVFINSKKITNSNSQGSGIAYVSGTYRSDDGSFGDLLPSVYSAPYPMCTTPYPSVTSSHIGPSHTVFISKSGFLLGCGNKHVLGLHVRSIGIINNDFKAQREIVSIFNERVLQVACGESYTAVLSGIYLVCTNYSETRVMVCWEIILTTNSNSR
jgi:alpha-tubulin suppressor-like RCC1 family protein